MRISDCPGLPGYRGIVNRSIWIKFQGLDHTDQIVKFEAENLLSQAIEHEVDHLNGILYTDHLAEHQQLFSIVEKEIQDPDGNYTESPASIKTD